MGTTGNTKFLSKTLGPDWEAGTYTFTVNAYNDNGNVKSNKVTITVNGKRKK